MNKELFSTYAEQTKNMFAPVETWNRLVVENAEKLVALQISAAKSYSALGFANLKALLEVHDAEALRVYVGKHSEFVKEVSERLADDVRAVAELGSDFSAEVQKLGKEKVKAISKAA